MDGYSSRLASLFSIPISLTISITALVEAGFQYTGRDDEVICRRCMLRYRGWQRGDDPRSIHLSRSPNCSFHQTSNICPGRGNGDTVSQSNDEESVQMSGACAGPIGISASSPKRKGSDEIRQNVADSLLAHVEHDTRSSRDNLGRQGVPNSLHNVHSANEQIIAEALRDAITEGNNASRVTTNNITQKADQNASNGQRLVNSYFTSIDSQSRTGEDVPNTVRTGPEATNANDKKHSVGFHQDVNGLKSVRPRFEQYAIHASRLASYKEWPKHLRQHPEELANAGLFYEGKNDYVRCFHCDGGLREWEPEDHPFVEHARWFPCCAFMRLVKGDEFIRGVQTGEINGLKNKPDAKEVSVNPENDENLFDHPAVLSVMEMGYSKQILLKAITVFRRNKGPDLSAKLLLQIVWDIEENAEGNTEDQCENANGDGEEGLHDGHVEREWEPEDDPFVEHARWFPCCAFMRLVKGDEFMRGVQTGEINGLKNKPDAKEVNVNPENDENLFDHPAVLSVMEMGYSKQILLKAITVFRRNKGPDLSAKLLLQIVWDIEENAEGNTEDQCENANGDVEEGLHDGNIEQENTAAGNGKNLEDLRKENRKLKEQKTCKVCLDEEASIVFLPCGHLVTCPMCASALRKCPACRTYIWGMVKAIISWSISLARSK